MAENAELFITEGVHRDFLGSHVLPKLGIEFRQKQVVPSVNEIERKEDSSDIQYSPIQLKFLTFILRDFKEIFDMKGVSKSFEVKMHFHELMRPIQIKGKRVRFGRTIWMAEDLDIAVELWAMSKTEKDHLQI